MSVKCLNEVLLGSDQQQHIAIEIDEPESVGGPIGVGRESKTVETVGRPGTCRWASGWTANPSWSPRRINKQIQRT